MVWFLGFMDWNEVFIVEGFGDGLIVVVIGYDVIVIVGVVGVNVSNVDEIVLWVDGWFVVICGDGDIVGSNFNFNFVKFFVECEVFV